MMWILLLVHITLHGMIGGLLKHFPKAVCRKNSFFFCLIIFGYFRANMNVKIRRLFIANHHLSICQI